MEGREFLLSVCASGSRSCPLFYAIPYSRFLHLDPGTQSEYSCPVSLVTIGILDQKRKVVPGNLRSQFDCGSPELVEELSCASVDRLRRSILSVWVDTIHLLQGLERTTRQRRRYALLKSDSIPCTLQSSSFSGLMMEGFYYYCLLGSSCLVTQTESRIIGFLILRPLTLNRALPLTSLFSACCQPVMRLSIRHKAISIVSTLLIIKYIISHHINLSFHCPPTHLFIFCHLGFSGEL